jgi:hypothetical protein
MYRSVRLKGVALACALAAFAAMAAAAGASARQQATVLEGDDLTRVVPTGFYFEKQSAPTQMRNTAAVQWGRGGRSRLVVAGLVDTSGYSTEVQAKYQGFFITDSPVFVGGRRLATGAYGFGFDGRGRINIFDISGARILSGLASKDRDIQRPRPLMMTNEAGQVRLYSGRDYAVLSIR